MEKTTYKQGITLKSEQDNYLPTWLNSFLLDRKAEGLAQGSLRFYYFLSDEGEAVLTLLRFPDYHKNSRNQTRDDPAVFAVAGRDRAQ